ncbi:MAG: polyprenol monophosphomannose synthase [Chloroflexi bacterium]|nr:polyprenol monophosphomannose synthase [Chloroflexota bacterium]
MHTLVVVPTYNEAQNIPELASQLFALGLPGLHLLVVDDNSPDGTAEIADELNQAYPGRVHVLRRPAKGGLGPAYVAGFREALRLGAERVLQMDADLSHPTEAVPRLLDALDRCDVAIGSRYIPGGGVDQEWGLSRKAMSRGGDLYVRAVLGLPVHDTKSGFKAFRREVLERLDLDSLQSKGFIFQAEVLYRCRAMGYRLQEVPFIFYDRRAGRSKLNMAIITEALWRSILLRWSKGPPRPPK